MIYGAVVVVTTKVEWELTHSLLLCTHLFAQHNKEEEITIDDDADVLTNIQMNSDAVEHVQAAACRHHLKNSFCFSPLLFTFALCCNLTLVLSVSDGCTV